jgi:hypothetical protein
MLAEQLSRALRCRNAPYRGEREGLRATTVERSGGVEVRKMVGAEVCEGETRSVTLVSPATVLQSQNRHTPPLFSSACRRCASRSSQTACFSGSDGRTDVQEQCNANTVI